MTDEDRTDDTRPTLAERMAGVARGDMPSALASARAHLGTADEPRGNLEQAMIAGADPETGELPARDAAEEHQRTVDYVQEQASPAPPVIETIPPAAPSVTAEMEPAMQPAPELSAPAQPSPVKQEVIEPERAVPKQEIIPPQRAAGGVLVAADELRLLIERVELLSEEKQSIADDIKDVYAEAKSRGYDAKTMRAIVRLRKMETHDRQEAEALLDTYKSALGLDVPYSGRSIADYSQTPLESAAA